MVIVQRGECLREIARREGQTVQELMERNGLEEPRLAVGQALLTGEAAETQQRRELCTIVSSQTATLDESGEARLRIVKNQREGRYSGSYAHELVSSREEARQWIETLLRELRRGGEKGVLLSFAELPCFDRELYHRFLADCSRRLHEEGCYFVVALAPKDVCGGEDYAAAAKYADRAVLFCCDWGHALSAPRAPAPIGHLRESIEKALREIPAEKLWLGISCTALDWSFPWKQGNAAAVLESAAALRLAAAAGAELTWDASAQTCCFRYLDPVGKRHEVWLEEQRSLWVKLKLLEEYSLAGCCLREIDRSGSTERVFHALYERKLML